MTMKTTILSAAVIALALTGPSLAEDASEKALNAAEMAVSEDPTQVVEEEAMEKKDGMDAQVEAAAEEATKGAADKPR
jgi:hypothetical protein